MDPIELFKLVDTIKGTLAKSIRITITPETIKLDIRHQLGGGTIVSVGIDFTRREIEGAAYPVDKILFAIKKLIKDLNERNN